MRNRRKTTRRDGERCKIRIRNVKSEWLRNARQSGFAADLPRQAELLHLVEQRLCLPQILRFKALGEPGVDGREKVERLLALALIDPQGGKVYCASKFESLGVLASCGC